MRANSAQSGAAPHQWSAPSPPPYSDGPPSVRIGGMQGISSESYSASLPSPEEAYNTLDEPVVTTIMRDLKAIGSKLRVVLLPREVYAQSGEDMCSLMFDKVKRAAHDVNEDGKKQKKKRKKKGKKYNMASQLSTEEKLSDLPDDLELKDEQEQEEQGGAETEMTTVKKDEGEEESEEESEEEDETEAAARAEEEERQKIRREREREIRSQEWEGERRRALREWDLWGPLLVCLSLGVLLSVNAPSADQSALTFSSVFVSMWCGSAVVTFNSGLLGGKLGLFQAACVLGYCVFPLNVAATAIVVLKEVGVLKRFSMAFKLPIVVVAFLWSTRASTVFVGQFIKPERRALAVYPVFLFYTFLAWLIVLI